MVSHSCFWFYSGPHESKFLNKNQNVEKKIVLRSPMLNLKAIQISSTYYQVFKLILRSFQTHFLALNFRYRFIHILFLPYLTVLCWLQFKLCKFLMRHTLTTKISALKYVYHHLSQLLRAISLFLSGLPN